MKPRSHRLIGIIAAVVASSSLAEANNDRVEKAFVLTAQAGAGSSGDTRSAGESLAQDSGRYGSRADGMFYDREIRVRPNTKSVGVWHLETIRFVTAEGREFRWRFDAIRMIDAFPLGRIAPSELALPADATVYVIGEIPIAP